MRWGRVKRQMGRKKWARTWERNGGEGGDKGEKIQISNIGKEWRIQKVRNRLSNSLH